MKLYLCGPMTGLPDYNYAAFDTAAFRLRARGFDVINPAEEFGGNQNLAREIYMRRSFENVLKADGVALLPDWDTSPGARLESAMAVELCIPIKSTGEWMASARPVQVPTPEEINASRQFFKKLMFLGSCILTVIGIALALLVVFGLGGCAGSERGTETADERAEREAGKRLQRTFNGL